MTFKIRSTKFESICREFARKLYKTLTYDDKFYLFSQKGYQSESFVSDSRLERVFQEIAAPLIRKAVTTLSVREYLKVCESYGIDDTDPAEWLAIEIIDTTLESLHKEWLKSLRSKPKLSDIEQYILDAYIPAINLPADSFTETFISPVQSKPYKDTPEPLEALTSDSGTSEGYAEVLSKFTHKPLDTSLSYEGSETLSPEELLSGDESEGIYGLPVLAKIGLLYGSEPQASSDALESILSDSTSEPSKYALDELDILIHATEALKKPLRIAHTECQCSRCKTARDVLDIYLGK